VGVVTVKQEVGEQLLQLGRTEVGQDLLAKLGMEPAKETNAQASHSGAPSVHSRQENMRITGT
jgi:hypothetical protein